MRRSFLPILTAFLVLTASSLSACSSGTDGLDTTIDAWQLVFDQDFLLKNDKIGGALLSVWGTSQNDVWMVGGAQEASPTTEATILNWNGTGWHRLQLSLPGTFWWVTGTDKGILWMVGKDGLVVRYDRNAGHFKQWSLPGKKQLWGLLAFADNDVWAVGGEAAECHDKLACGVIWHYDGTNWTAPNNLPAGWEQTAWFKVFGRGPNDVFFCGMNGHILHWNGSVWADEIPVNTVDPSAEPSKLLTGSCSGSLCVAVGGEATGAIVEHDGSKWTRKVIPGLDALNGVWVNPDGSAIAVGYSIWRRATDGTWSNDPGAPLTGAQFHAVYVDPTGGAWTVGGDLIAFKTSALAHFGDNVIPAPVTPVP
jgi:hypothetical protein